MAVSQRTASRLPSVFHSEALACGFCGGFVIPWGLKTEKCIEVTLKCEKPRFRNKKCHGLPKKKWFACVLLLFRYVCVFFGNFSCFVLWKYLWVVHFFMLSWLHTYMPIYCLSFCSLVGLCFLLAKTKLSSFAGAPCWGMWVFPTEAPMVSETQISGLCTVDASASACNVFFEKYVQFVQLNSCVKFLAMRWLCWAGTNWSMKHTVAVLDETFSAHEAVHFQILKKADTTICRSVRPPDGALL